MRTHVGVAGHVDRGPVEGGEVAVVVHAVGEVDAERVLDEGVVRPAAAVLAPEGLVRGEVEDLAALAVLGLLDDALEVAGERPDEAPHRVRADAWPQPSGKPAEAPRVSGVAAERGKN